MSGASGGSSGGGGGGDLTQAEADTLYAQIYMPITTEGGTTIQLGLSHAGQYVNCTSNSAVTAVVNKQADVAWAAETEIFIRQGGDGIVTLSDDSGAVTLTAAGGTATAGVGTVLSLKRISQNVWNVGTPGMRGASGSTNKQMVFNLSNAGSVIGTGNTGQQFIYGFSGTIVGWYISGSDGAGGTGSCVLDIWKLAYHVTNLPTVSNTITASAKPTCTTAKNATSSTLTGWTTSITAGDQFMINVDSCSGFKFITLVLILS